VHGEIKGRHWGGADKRRDFLPFTRGPDRHRELATPLQHDQAPRLNRIQTTSTRGVRARIRRVACATPTGFAGHAGATANLKLTFHLDHSAGADHSGHGLNVVKCLWLALCERAEAPWANSIGSLRSTTSRPALPVAYP